MESSEIEGVVTTEVRETHRFDVASLERYMRAHVAGFRGPLDVRQFKGGQSNPTFPSQTPGAQYVLRAQAAGQAAASAHAVDREYRVISRARPAPTCRSPRTYVLCEDDAIIGTAFYIMEYVRRPHPGRSGAARHGARRARARSTTR